MIEQLEREEWLAVWQATGREPYAHPSYLEGLRRADERVMAVGWRGATGAALLPLVVRPLPAWCGEGQDAISPYGYGGPFISGELDWESFGREFIEWMQSQRLVSCFVRGALDAIPEEISSAPGLEARTLTENVVVDLTRSGEDQWRHYDHKVRKNVNKARRGGLRVEIDHDFKRLDEFLAVYESTMARRDADEFYYFDRDFFLGIASEMDGSYVVAHVVNPNGQVVSTELVLASDKRYYSFLGGTLQEAFHLAPNDLLKHAVIEHGAENGRTEFVLGGGYSTGDGIFRYKRSFDRDGVRAFRGVCAVADREAYEGLTARWQSRLETDPAVVPNFFPLYRATIF